MKRNNEIQIRYERNLNDSVHREKSTEPKASSEKISQVSGQVDLDPINLRIESKNISEACTPVTLALWDPNFEAEGSQA